MSELMTPGEWVGLLSVIVILVALLIWIDDGIDWMYDDEEPPPVDPSIEAMRADAGHASEWPPVPHDWDGCGPIDDDEIGFDPARPGDDRTVIMTDPDEHMNLEELNPAPEFARMELLSRLSRTGHINDDEAKELQGLRARLGYWEDER
jgi:hypothetical protein